MSTHNYLSWEILDAEKIVGNDGSYKITAAEIEKLYEQGYLATRLGKNIFTRTRSLRIDLKKFELSSENRRILRKNEEVELIEKTLPLSISLQSANVQTYDWNIAKMAKDFYARKFGDCTFSANKAKELLTDDAKSTFNTLLIYKKNGEGSAPVGYCICLKTKTLIHYCYPFYELDDAITRDLPNLGLGMMTKAVEQAKKDGLEYFYLGSYQRAADTYKLQFTGLEWFDGKAWRTDTENLKKVL